MGLLLDYISAWSVFLLLGMRVVGMKISSWKVGPRAELKMWGPYIMNCRRNQWVFPWGFHETPRNQWSYICFLLAGDGAQLVKIVFFTFEDAGNDVTIFIFPVCRLWNVDSLEEGRNNKNTQPLVTKFPPTVAGKDGFTPFPGRLEGWDS